MGFLKSGEAVIDPVARAITDQLTITSPVDLDAIDSSVAVNNAKEANSPDATLLARANHTGSQLASTISNFDAEVSNNTQVTANTNKIGVTTQTTNQTDAVLKARANHTGTQTANTISDFDTEVSNNTQVTANTGKTGVTNEVPSDVTGINGSAQITNMVSISQSNYDAIGTPNASTLYIIV